MNDSVCPDVAMVPAPHSSQSLEPVRWGGVRPGAGRKPTELSRELVPVRKATAEGILLAVDETGLWQELLKSPDQRIRLDALKYLTDKRDGKAPQNKPSEEKTSPVLVVRVSHVADDNTPLRRDNS